MVVVVTVLLVDVMLISHDHILVFPISFLIYSI